MLQRGDQVPHFTVVTVDGARAAYDEIWQRRNLLLVTVGERAAHPEPDRASQLAALVPDMPALETAYVITRDTIAGAPARGVVIADRWGEVQFVADETHGAPIPAGEILDWLRYVQQRCPECEGEAR